MVIRSISYGDIDIKDAPRLDIPPHLRYEMDRIIAEAERIGNEYKEAMRKMEDSNFKCISR